MLAVILAAVAIALPGRTNDLYELALCRLERLTGGECDEGEQEADEEEEYPYDLTPAYCVRDGRSETAGYQLDLGIFRFGQQYTYSKETLSDGSVVVTFVPSTEVGVRGGVGFDFGQENAAALAADVEGGVSAKLAPGMTYIFEDQAEFEEFEEEVEASIAEETNRQMNPESQIGLGFAEWLGVYDPPEVRDPTVRTGTIDVTANLLSEVGLWTNENRGPRRNDENLEGNNLNLGVDGSLSYGGKVDVSHWFGDPDNTQTSWTTTYTATGSLGGYAFTQREQLSGSWSGGQRVTRNEDGSLANIRYMTTVQGQFAEGTDGRLENREINGGRGGDTDGEGTRVVQMVQIDFDTPEEREIGERLLAERGMLPPANVIDSMRGPLMDDRSGGEINEEPGPDAPDWEHLFYERGRVWQYEADVTSDQTAFNAQIKLGLQLGASVNWGVEERHTREAQILDRPRDGSREFIDFPDCLSQEQDDE
ncbi:hypothetical protein ACFOVU_05300 [Nocardiopsis sediminis]|uniref:Uncharacterized protein n=1 Tax=Nocardiopsis sediminis TaxID=1778267 RepID=A0ABV8FGU4_9ACTN